VLGDLFDLFVSAPKNLDDSFSLVGEGNGGGAINEVDLGLCFMSLRKVGDRGFGFNNGVVDRAVGGRGEFDLDPVCE
jgi:hypothetical protein